MPKLSISAYDRIMNNFVLTDLGCWEWTGPKNNKGYGTTSVDGINKMAHRAVFELLVGDIPVGLTLDHLCENKICINPDHLEPTSNKENNSRGNSPSALNGRKFHCLNGHPYNEENTYFAPNGGRWCRPCRNNYMYQYNRVNGIVKGLRQVERKLG